MGNRLFSLALLLLTTLTSLSSASDDPFRILHVMSYHQSWAWNIDQLKGFRDGLGDLPYTLEVIELDTKNNSDPAAIQARADAAKKAIESWQPDLLYTNDDNAQKFVAQDYVNTDLPIVFSAVNREPEEYGFDQADNVTGVMEYEHFVPTINLLKSLNPEVRRLAVIIDPDPTWQGVMERMREGLKNFPELEVTEWIMATDIEQYRSKILQLQDQVDAIALLGIFNIKDELGNDVDYRDILQWTAENSLLPDFSYWESRIDAGTLCAVAVSGYEQGLLAGTMARDILLGTSPDDIAIRPSEKGEPMMNLARAKRLGLDVDVKLLLESKVKTEFSWN